MNEKRDGFGIVYDSKRKDIYVFGGLHKSFLNHCEKYSIENDKWTNISPMSNGKQNASACIFDNKVIYVIGGYNKDFCVNDFEKYSIANGKW